MPQIYVGASNDTTQEVLKRVTSASLSKAEIVEELNRAMGDLRQSLVFSSPPTSPLSRVSFNAMQPHGHSVAFAAMLAGWL